MKLKLFCFLIFAASFLTLSAKNKPNILFIVSEDNGPELGCYGDKYVSTPTLDKMAESGVRFENAYVPYSVCSPSRACFYTGLYPQQNGHLGLATHKFQLYRKFPWIGSYLSKEGYKVGLIGKLHVNPESYFEVDYRAIRGANFGKGQRDPHKYAKAAATMFKKSGDNPFFITINYPDAHFPLHNDDHGYPKKKLTADDVKTLPFVGIDTPALRKNTAAYYNCMRRLDDSVDLLFQELKKSGKFDNTLIIYIGDHGAQFSRGKTSVYEAGLRIPMIVSWPGNMKPGTVSEKLVSSIDILPTCLKAVGIKIPDYLPGKPLQDLMDGSEKGGHDVICGITTGSAPGIFAFSISVRDKDYKLIWNPATKQTNLSAKAYRTHYNHHFSAGSTTQEIAEASPKVQAAYKTWENPPEFELYDLRKDPLEWTNLAGNPEYKAALAKMKKTLIKWQKDHNDPFQTKKRVDIFVKEQQKYIKNGKYRKKGFIWNYIKEFKDFSPNVTQ